MADEEPDNVTPAAPRPKKVFRSRKKGGDGDSEGEGGGAGDAGSGGADVRVSTDELLLLREEQKNRNRARGVAAAALSSATTDGSVAGKKRPAPGGSSSASSSTSGAADADANKFGLNKVAPKSEFERSFTGQKGTSDSLDAARLRAFIEERMKAQGAGSTVAAEGAGVAVSASAKVARRAEELTSAAGPRLPEDDPVLAAAAGKNTKWLYELPANLKRPGADSGRDGDVGEGGMMLAGTGIAEVALPTEEKLRNIEETERLRQQMLERRAARAAEMADDGGLPHARYTSGSITANYTMHRREFAMNMKGVAPSNPLQQRSASAQLGGAAYAPAERGERPAGDRPAGDRPAGDRAARPALAHDDAVFNKFRRRELGRMR